MNTQMIKFNKRPARIHPIVTIALVVIIFATICGIIYIWNTVSQRAGQAIIVQNIVEKDGTLLIYVQNVGEEPVLLEFVQINSVKIEIQKNMCIINGEYTNILPEGKTASINVEQEIEKKTQIKVIAKGGAFAVWLPPP